MKGTKEIPVDQLIEDVRDRRRQLMESCGNDLRVLLKKIEVLQRQHPEKLRDNRPGRSTHAGDGKGHER